MATYDKRIDAYIAKSADFAKPILEHLRELIHEACPDVEETMKWSFPHFDYMGATICSMAAFKQHAVFGFWKASIMQDPHSILETANRSAMGHMGQLTDVSQLPKASILKQYIKQAAKLNADGIKIPSKPKAAKKAALEVPEELMKALKKNKAALKTFEGFSNTNKKEYTEWVSEAKTDATRDKRIAQAIEQMAEGKIRHWKYQKG